MIRNISSSSYITVIQEHTIKFNLKLPGVPSEPRDFDVKDTTSTTVTLKWKEPESNGGLPIKLYFLERKEKKFGSWVKERKIKVPSTEFTVEGLREGVDYYFRLLAENDEGSSKPVETSQVFQLTKAPSKYIV